MLDSCEKRKSVHDMNHRTLQHSEQLWTQNVLYIDLLRAMQDKENRFTRAEFAQCLGQYIRI